MFQSFVYEDANDAILLVNIHVVNDMDKNKFLSNLVRIRKTSKGYQFNGIIN